MTRALRVTVLVESLAEAGGAERIARGVAMRLDPSRFRPTLCVTRWSPERERDPAAAASLAELRAAGVEFLGLARSSRADLLAWRPLLARLRAGTDIVHSHMFGSNFWGTVMTAVAGTPVFIAHEHGWSYRGRPLRRMLDRRLIASRADAFVAVSREGRRRMIEVEGIDPGDVVVVPNGIPELTEPSERDLRSELGISGSDQVIGTVCVLRPEKSLGVLVRAVAELRREFPAVRLLIVGEGPERGRIERLIRDLDLGERVQLVGHRDDVADLLRVFDLAVCSSEFEGSPLSVIEYMAAGLAVVGTRVGGLPELIEDRATGILVDPGDPGELAAGIAPLLREPRRAVEMGRQGRERQQRNFSLDAVARRVEELYEDLYARSRRRSFAAHRPR